MDENKFRRTMTVVKELSEGKKITLDGVVFGMGEDMSIGAVLNNGKGEEFISGLCTIDIKQLNYLIKTKFNL